MRLSFIFIAILLLLLVGCGSSGSSSSTNNSSSSLATGIFIDSKVQGLHYTTSTQSGYTNSNGQFQYLAGEKVNFYIGNIFIGSSLGQSVLTPIDIVSNGNIDNIKVLNIARVLQSFDSDKDPSNGISLVSQAVNLNSNLAIDFNSVDSISKLIAEVNSTNHNITEVNITQAQNHLKETYDLFTNGDDPSSSQQYYLDDLNITNIQNDYNGSGANGSIIQIVDTGIEPIHEDIFANIDLSKSYNAETSTSQNCNPDSGESHGTKCAGVTNARGFNNKGVKGIVPLGKVVGFKMQTNSGSSLVYTQSDLEKAWLSGDGANDITISSNSWGICYHNSTDEESILAQGVANLRDGKGRIYVFAGGNDRDNNGEDSNCYNGSSNLSTLTNNQYSIAVASVDQNNKISNFSSPGSNILISGYGDNLYTTTLNNSYDYFSGTSAATPLVAGSIGLILEACPNLTYRDVKYILATTATKIDSSNTTWITNSAGLKYSVDYGYGLINISGAIKKCKNNYSPLPSKQTIEVTNDTDVTLATNGDTTTIDLNITDNISIEWVGVYLDVNLDDSGDYEYNLISPAGTTT
jgi:subtilisin family serine protease